jgi:drug/metabolite transporter (DMT)-like permease
MGIIGNLYSPFVILLSFAFLGERLSLLQIAGFALVSIGVVIIARQRRSPMPATTPATDDVETLRVAALADAAGGHAIGIANAAVPGVATPHRIRGALLAVLSIALMAIAIVMVKRVLEAQPLVWVTATRLAGAVGGLAFLAMISGNAHRLRPRGVRIDWRLLLAAAFVGQFLAMILWLGGYKYTQASIAAILNETSSVFIVVLAWIWLHEPLGRRGALGVTLTLCGVALMLL